ncbi:MAG: asparagine synthase (glutamine-hydrolyzing) [Oscillospiraceae bacterium]|jgi:asparagine synthase (glutamine-hydrolysing)|nr:asparagine synthase (glutamine-hydrolyzing) [Oscillospiraceae bacterium]
MCGIAGMVNFEGLLQAQPEQTQARLHAAAHALRHRGPDGSGTFRDDTAGLAHTRLAIIDPMGAPQPMTRTRGGHTHALVYNGELYNTQELRAELPGPWKTTGDTEVLLAGLMARGASFLRELNGIFAFGYWDDGAQTLLLARDRLGVKPLYYALAQGTLFFGSEPKALFALGVAPKIDDDSLREVFALGPAHTPGNGVFAGLRELLPGEVLHFGRDGLRRELYWQLQSRPHQDSHDDTIARVRWLVEDSVERQMVSDVPICTFLSGGLDSSLLTAICAQKLRARGDRLTTFSFDFDGNDDFYRSNAFQPSRDAPFARKMARHLQTNHIELTCDNVKLADLLEAAMQARDVPGMADVDASLLYFCSQVGDDFKVTLTGECADEVFGGYPWFCSPQAFSQQKFPWSDMDARRSFLREEVLAALDLESYAQTAYDASVAKTPRRADDSPEESRRREIAWLNLCWFMQTLLDRMDRMSMSSCLEARVPFADHRILEYVWNIPWSLQHKDETAKYVLRMAGRGWLPGSVLWRKKSPYPKTYNPLYAQILTQRLRDILASPNEPVNALIDRKKAEAFLNAPADYGKPWYGQLMAAPQRIAYFLQVNGWLKQWG